MKNTIVYQLVFGVLGIIALILYICMDSIDEGWLFLPAFVMGVCAIPMWFGRKKHFAFSDKERDGLKKANKVSVIATVLFSCMLAIIKLSTNLTERMTWGFVIAFVAYFFLTVHAFCLLTQYKKINNKN